MYVPDGPGNLGVAYTRGPESAGVRVGGLEDGEGVPGPHVLPHVDLDIIRRKFREVIILISKSSFVDIWKALIIGLNSFWTCSSTL